MTDAEDQERSPNASAEVLEVLANPFRQRAYDTLLVFGDMTARQMSRLTRLSEASLNHHMRQLAKIDFVRAVNPDAPRRQVVWQAQRRALWIDEISGDEEYIDAAQAWGKAHYEAESHVLQDWIDVSDTWPKEWFRATQQANYLLHALTVEQLEVMGREMHELVIRWRDVSDEQRAARMPGTRPVYVATNAVPWPADYSELEGDAE